MRFSDRFGIERQSSDDWFDPFLAVDTQLFVDPFLIYADSLDVFAGSHEEIIGFFNSMFTLIARSGCNPKHLAYQQAINHLMLPEVEELCLGYTSSGTRGAGSGRDLAVTMAAAIAEAITHGLQQIRHLEEIAILREGIGADRISDATGNILRRHLAQYTEGICRQHGVPAKRVRYARGYYDPTLARWRPLVANLPINPHSRKPLLLVPECYLNSLPTINPDDFWEFCYSNENSSLRQEFNYDIATHVAKREIVSLARQHPEMLERYVDYIEGSTPHPYDFRRDKKGLTAWYRPTQDYCRDHPLDANAESHEAFASTIEKMLKAFKHFIEEKKGWRLLWNDDGKARPENAAQLALLGVIAGYCEENDIDISREPDVGRGPVDFKASRGYSLRMLLEVKLASNTRFWDGLEAQLPGYLNAEKVSEGYFVVIVHSDSDAKRVKDIQQAVEAVNGRTGSAIKQLVVDARRKVSASKLRA